MSNDPFEFDLKELRDLINAMPDAALKAGEAAMEKTLLYLHGQLPPYPPPPLPGNAAKFWTDKQRRFFFAAVKKGLIKVPYRRTGTLGRQFTTETRHVDDGIEGEIGTATPYAPWVVGPDYPGEVFAGKNNGQPMYQARIHENRWWQFDEVIYKALPEAEKQFADEFFAEFNRLTRSE